MLAHLSHRGTSQRMAARKTAVRLRRLAAILAAVIGGLLASAVVVPAAFAMTPVPGPGGRYEGPPLAPIPATTTVHVATGGMAGWQITLIAVGAALVAAAAAVLLDRGWAAASSPGNDRMTRTGDAQRGPKGRRKCRPTGHAERLRPKSRLSRHPLPLSFGRCISGCHPDLDGQASVELCGDDFGVHLHVTDGRITAIRFHGHGCALPISAASYASDRYVGLPLADIPSLTTDWVLDLLPVTVPAIRQPCAVLHLHAVLSALAGSRQVYLTNG